jgi:hypothetical protein
MSRAHPKVSGEEEYSTEEEEIEPEPPTNISLKTGKPKRVMSEAQKQNLVKARAAARIKKDELKGMRLQEKKLKKEEHLVKKLDLEARIKAHEDNLRLLAYKAGRVSKDEYEATTEKKIRKKSVKKDHLADDEVDNEENKEISALEEKLEKLKFKSKIKKPKAIKEESEIEESSEEELSYEPPKRSREHKGTPAKKPQSRSNSVESTSSRSGNPKIKLEKVEDVPSESKRFKNKNPMVRDQPVSGEQDKLKSVMASLFPTTNF